MIKYFLIAVFSFLMPLCAETAAAPAATEQTTPNPYQIYQSGKPETIKGKVISINRLHIPGSNSIVIIRATIQTDKGFRQVHLGPEKFLEKLNLKVNRGDEIEVTGSHVSAGKNSVIFAAEINKDGTVFKLRDKETGEPLIPVDEQK